MAFQKVERLSVDGQHGPQTQAALATASTPGPMVPGGSPTRIEIDVARQVMFHWVNGSLEVPAGTRVHVLNSPEAEAPPDEGKAVPNATIPPDTTTTTQAPPPTTTTTTFAEVPETTTTTEAVVATIPPTTTIIVP